MKKILITGGLGFLGSHLAKNIAQNPDFAVSVIDAEKYFFDKGKYNYNYYKNQRINILKQSNIDIYNIDLLNIDDTTKTIKKIKPDIIIHLASVSVAGIADYYPVLAKENIFDSTFNLLQIIVNKFPIEKLIYISSSMVYGHFPKNKNEEIISPDEETPCNPIDIYGSFKLCCENLIKTYHLRKHVPYTIIRPTAIYGPSDCNFRVSELFVTNALLNRPILLDNGGLHKLDFTYIDDIINGIVSAIENKNALNQTFNISYGKGRTIKELAEIIKTQYPETFINLSNCKPFRPNRGALDISKAKSLLNFSPKFSLEKGIEIYLNYVKKHIANLKYPKKYF